MNFSQALQYAISKFKDAKIETAHLDARLLLSYIVNKPFEYIILNQTNETLTKEEYSKFLNYISRRINLEPIAYIIGSKEFYGRNFKVNKHVLIPRPDTEILIEAILSSLSSDSKDYNILELGIGSGCIIITLLLEITQASGLGTDISNEALLITHKNGLSFKVMNRLKLIRSNWFAQLKETKFDIIVSNPPYISIIEENIVSPSAYLYEPHKALFAGLNGLNSYFEIAKGAKYFLNKNGKLFIEIGFNQTESVNNIFLKEGYIIHSVYKDLNNHNRVICLGVNDS